MTEFKCFDFVVGKTPAGSLAFMQQQMLPNLNDWFCKDEIVYTKPKGSEKYEDSNILIVAGGPTSHSIDYNLWDYDFVWSMNHFFKNKRFRNTKFDLVVIGAEVDTTDQDYQKYLFRYGPHVGFEPHHKWLSNKIPKYEKTFAFATHFYGKIGVAARMMILASEFGVKTVSFVGVDGPRPIFEGNHAFEPGKTLMPSQINQSNADEVFQFQYDTFWKYAQKTFPNVSYRSLDKENLLHRMINEVSA